MSFLSYKSARTTVHIKILNTLTAVSNADRVEFRVVSQRCSQEFSSLQNKSSSFGRSGEVAESYYTVTAFIVELR